MEIKVLFLGPARDLVGLDATSLEVSDEATATSVGEAIASKYPHIGAALPTMRLAVNQAFVANDHVLRAGDEVALIPPVSGG